MTTNEHFFACSVVLTAILIIVVSVAIDLRSLDLLKLSICSFCGKTGFSDGTPFWFLVAIVLVAAGKMNFTTPAFLASLTYSILFFLHGMRFGTNMSKEIFFEFPSAIWWLMPISVGEYYLYAILGKSVQFFVVGAIAYFAFRLLQKRNIEEVNP